jgi:hypothetical protein
VFLSRFGPLLLVLVSVAGIAGCEAAAQDQRPSRQPQDFAYIFEAQAAEVDLAPSLGVLRASQTRLLMLEEGLLRDQSGTVSSSRCSQPDEEAFAIPAACDELDIVSMNATYRAFLFSNGHDVLVVVYEGHRGCGAELLPDTKALIERILERADVLYLDIPLLGTNCYQEFRIGDISYWGPRHDWFGLADEPKQSALVYFFNHLNLALNYFGPRYRTTHMTGRSGGGWATTVYAAIDWRIERSVSVAGSLPIELRTPELDYTDDFGDWEQSLAYLYKIVSYQDLYEAGGGIAEPRRHVEIYNEFDECCFSGMKGMAAAADYASSPEGYLQERVRFLVNQGEHHHVIPVEMVMEQLFGP